MYLVQYFSNDLIPLQTKIQFLSFSQQFAMQITSSIQQVCSLIYINITDVNNTVLLVSTIHQCNTAQLIIWLLLLDILKRDMFKNFADDEDVVC